MIDATTSLRHAVAAAWHGGGPASLTRRVRQDGPDVFADVYDRLDADQRVAVVEEADALADRGVSALLLGSAGYPGRLTPTRAAPPVLFCLGPTHLLDAPAIGVCGSRHASAEGLRAAATCGEIAAAQGLTVVSGYARGVDTVTHTATLQAGGKTVVVLPEGITRFRVKRGELGTAWDPGRVLVLSQFPPSQPWHAGSAMARNSVIFGLGQALVVVEAGETGGTLAAGMRALEANQHVITLEGTPVAPGNAMLLRRGAVPVRSRAELSSALGALAGGTTGGQLTIL